MNEQLSTGMDQDQETSGINDNILRNFEKNLFQLKEAPAFAKGAYVIKLQALIEVLADTREGIEFLYEKIPDLYRGGLFNNSAWENEEGLVSSLVGGTLKADPTVSLMELMSELRILAIAQRKITNKNFSQKMARQFLKEIIINNLELVFPSGTEDLRFQDMKVIQRGERLFNFILSHLPMEGIKEKLSDEIEAICAQRPVSTERVVEMIDLINEHLKLDPSNKDDTRLLFFVDAIHGPTTLSRNNPSLDSYRNALNDLDEEDFRTEMEKLARRMNRTGLVSWYHAVAVKIILEKNNGTLGLALGMDATGKAELKKHRLFVGELFEQGLSPETAQMIYGMARTLERGLLSRQPVINGLKKIMQMKIHPEVAENLKKSLSAKRKPPANSILLADVINVLGQPIGIGQGWNPTCQTARGISLWSQHAPGKLLGLIVDAATQNNLEFRFENEVIISRNVIEGVAGEIDFKLDSVSVVLVPHLDKIYNEMMKKASLRNEDPHKWVNPALYGQWIPTGFACPYDQVLNVIKDYDNYLRLFYTTHHPDYNGGHDLAYPNPVGIFITAPGGKFLGFHAISLLRIGVGPRKDLRIYFLNPNNEGRQDWETDIRPSVMDNGEEPGESSLPFEQLASRIYAFHYNPSDVGDTSQVENDKIEKVKQMARVSWGKAYTWI